MVGGKDNPVLASYGCQLEIALQNDCIVSVVT